VSLTANQDFMANMISIVMPVITRVRTDIGDISDLAVVPEVLERNTGSPSISAACQSDPDPLTQIEFGTHLCVVHGCPSLRAIPVVPK
jgi:hypothetical protein